MKVSKNIILILILSISFNVFGQQKLIDYSKLTPPSPEVAELAKYTSIPVSYYSGVPNISIPIGTLSCGNISVPVSLSYNAGGIQVDQTASNVGLGWSLQAGGCISQTVNGLDDIRTSRFTLTYDDIKNKRWPNPYVVQSLSESETVDTDPDIFSYNFQEYSGRFLLDENKNIWNIKNSKDLKISYSIDNLVYFKMTDLYGNEYDFHEPELTDTYTHRYKYSLYYPNELNDVTLSPGCPPPAKRFIPTAYHLNTIISADKKHTVAFNYNTESIIEDSKLSGSLVFSVYSKQWMADGIGDIASAPLFTKTTFTHTTKKIQSINGDNGESFVFEYDTSDRLDLSGSKALKKIYQKDINGYIIKTWTLNYGYFTASPQIQNTSLGYLNYRLKLVSVTEESNNKTDQIYRFDYYGDSSQETQMPYRTAYCGQDIWGYCNANNVSTNSASDIRKLFPNLNILNSTEKKAVSYCLLENQNIQFTAGSDRQPNPKYVNTYSLKAIHYPTGGKSEFIYEPNDYSFGGTLGLIRNTIAGGQRIKEIKKYFDDNSYSSQKYEYTINDSTQYNSSGCVINESSPLYQSMHPLRNPTPTGRTKDFFLQLCSSSFTSLYSVNGDCMGYSQVTEENSEGKTVYNYYSQIDAPDTYDCTFYLLCNYDTTPYATVSAKEPYPASYATPGIDNIPLFANAPSNAYNGNSYIRGLLNKKTIFNKNNKKIWNETYNYNFTEKKRIYGADVYKDTGNGGFETILGVHYYTVGKAQLSDKTQKEYHNNDSSYVKISETYQYNDYDLITESVQTTSNGNNKSSFILYPSEINASPYNNMKALNMINYPIESMTKKNGKIIQSALLTYKETNSTYLPDMQFELHTETPLGLFTSFDGTTKDSHYKTKMTVTRYDEKNNVTELKDEAGISYVLLWGYNYRYLIAEIKNATYQAVSAACPNLNTLLSASFFLMTGIDALREKLPEAQITTYTYIPNIGISSKTDERGIKYSYYYDSAGRLESIKDENGNIISAYKYNYINN
jgi:YD repeat-containing protein